MKDKLSLANNLLAIMRAKDMRPLDLIKAVDKVVGEISPSSISNYLSLNISLF